MGVKEQLRAIVVKKPVVKLNNDEACVFQANCQFGKQVEKITTTSKPGLGVGVGIPVTKHIGIGVGKAKVKTTTKKEMVWEKQNCVLLLTTSRFLFKISNNVYEFDFETFQDIKLNKDAITVVSNGRPYYFFMKNSEVKRFVQTWSLVGEAGKQGISPSDLL